MGFGHATSLSCVRCGASAPLSSFTCPRCGLDGILDPDYDLDAVGRALTPGALSRRAEDCWRYRELLPLDDEVELPPPRMTMTPVYESPRLADRLGVARAWVKDEGRNPSGSFKDRASALAVALARAAGARTVSCASTGNAASSLALMAASAGLDAVIFVPQRAPAPKVAQLLVHGARVLRVRGDYAEAWDLCQAITEKRGWYNRNCAVNPWLVEGKKTCGLEIAEQMGPRMPAWVAVSVGDGCTIAGIWKGLSQMRALGFVPRLPRLLGVQARGCAPLARAFEEGSEEVTAAAGDTIADSIAVKKPRNARKALRAVRSSRGAFVRVSDDEILAAMRHSATLAAVFSEPAGAAATAGVAAARRAGIIAAEDDVLIVATGSGLKDTASATRAAGAPLDVEPRLEAVEALV
jgi:threonine synthase